MPVRLRNRKREAVEVGAPIEDAAAFLSGEGGLDVGTLAVLGEEGDAAAASRTADLWCDRTGRKSGAY